jgi:hypothetical protein
MPDSGAFHVVFVGHDHGALDVAEGTLALTVGVSRGAAEAAGGFVAPTDVARVGPNTGASGRTGPANPPAAWRWMSRSGRPVSSKMSPSGSAAAPRAPTTRCAASSLGCVLVSTAMDFVSVVGAFGARSSCVRNSSSCVGPRRVGRKTGAAGRSAWVPAGHLRNPLWHREFLCQPMLTGPAGCKSRLTAGRPVWPWAPVCR